MEVTVEKLVYGGYGLARHEGRVLLIPFAAPGDRLVVKIVRDHHSFALASIERIVQASPYRRQPLCPSFQTCGGCQLQHLTYPAQQAAKLAFLRESLSRLAGIQWSQEIELISGPEFEYRLKAQFQIQSTGHHVRLGYFQPESHDLCEIDSCPLLSGPLNEALRRLRLLPASRLRGQRTISLIHGDDQRLATWPAVGLSDSDDVCLRVGEFTYQLDAQSFVQVNRFLLEKMLQMVVDEEGGRCVVDLYCGVGFFTIPLARRFERAIGVDSNPRAVRLAMTNAQRNGTRHARFVAAAVEHWLSQAGEWRSQLDLVLVDPPRPGLSRQARRGLLQLRPARLIYVSCNPTTLARDLKQFRAEGYTLYWLAAIDLFPQTFHIETIAKLQRD